MTNIKKLYGPYLLVLFLSINNLWAQEKASITFDNKIHKFGEVKEEAGPIVHEFIFTNTGNAPLKIGKVKASCGCTTPGWSTDSIMPGGTGFIKAQYNPTNRPGAFKKSLTVTSNAETTVLFIEGRVIPKPKKPEDEYRIKIGGLRVKSKYLNMGKMTSEKPVSKNFIVYNDSNDAIKFLENYVGPDHIKVTFDPETLPPYEKGTIRLTYDPKARNDLGYTSDNLMVITDEASDSNKQFHVMATIEEYFPSMTAQELENAPKISFDETLHDFGEIRKGDLARADFTITNIGKSPLNIRKTKANCGCTVSKLAKNDIEPGESIALKVVFNSTGKVGNQQKSITVYSNDPTGPTKVLTIKAKIRE
ncbi:DUF1573 domain-containing protein [Fulvivirgaceae bacterium BMA10]|uniref:DUF1573 domain-containing protein n=1 Tax=Splendidivirga corallicola TaxID=3051826 RepID=A0ABT8KUJ4_9BACT|nr:DUF1573 domain-containing protein [Fulvivirgaceae bacterium BMA10]